MGTHGVDPDVVVLAIGRLRQSGRLGNHDAVLLQLARLFEHMR
jgi:hypothetical protein